MNPAIYYLSSLEIDVPYVPTGVIMPDGKVWDQKNLNTSRYSDGTPIPRISVNATWEALTTGGCRFYDNDSTNAALLPGTLALTKAVVANVVSLVPIVGVGANGEVLNVFTPANV